MTTVVLNNRYRVIRELGKGGFGETFLAVDTHLPSERYCVIKQLYPIISKPKQYQWVRERFQREAAILEALSRGSHQIPQLYAYFEEADTFYLVQEYIPGMTLTEKVQQKGVLSPQEVTSILVSLLQVLDYVHRQHIIHRDVKPDNIILREKDGQPVLIDFGVVKEALETVMDSDRTHSIAIGTPGYMPSEQAAGRPIYSSDLYSLGLTAVFLLSGQAPHTLETDSHTGELLWRKAVPDLHGQLAGVIDRAVRFHPRDRWKNAQEMLSALQNAQVNNISSNFTQKQHTTTARATVAAVSPPSEEKNQNRNPAFVWGVIGGLLIVSAAVVGYGMVQVLESLRRDNNSDSIVSEPPPVSESTPPPSQEEQEKENPPETNSQEKEEVNQPTPPPEPEPQPTPEPQLDLGINSPTVVVPTVPLEDNSPDEPSLNDVPIFSTGVEKTEVLQTLGEPTSIRPGYWENTQSVLYKDYVEGKLDLGLIFDRDTEKLRQTEASFASDVNLSIMEDTLKQMLQGELSPVIAEALIQVYQQETDLRSFTLKNWKGIIQRQPTGTIYIGVWEEDLH